MYTLTLNPRNKKGLLKHFTGINVPEQVPHCIAYAFIVDHVGMANHTMHMHIFL